MITSFCQRLSDLPVELTLGKNRKAVLGQAAGGEEALVPALRSRKAP
jgi:hypothetical protein